MMFIAKYDPLPEFALSDLQMMRLNVFDAGHRSLGRGTRGRTDYEYTIQIVTQVQIADSLSVMLSRLKILAEQIEDFFMFIQPTGCEETIDRVDVSEFGTNEDLEEKGLGRFAMQLVFFGHRDKPE